MSYIEQILEIASHKTTSVRPRTRHMDHCCRSKNEHIGHILQWNPSHRCASVGQPRRTYLQKLSTDMGQSLEDLLKSMDYRGKRQKRVREIVLAGRLDDDEA